MAAAQRIGVVRSVPLPAAQPGETKSVAVDMIAPNTPGIHRSTWKPRAPDGTFFPYEQYVIIDVRATKTDTAAPLLRFVADATIPDGTTIAPGQTFTKTWTVKNDGNKVWDATYALRATLLAGKSRITVRFVAGPESRIAPVYRLRIIRTRDVAG